MPRIYRIICLLAMVATAWGLKAGNLICMSIQHTDGTQSNIAVSQTLEITFTDELIQLDSTEDSVSYSIAEVAGWKYEITPSDAGIGDILAPTIVFEGKKVRFEGNPTPCMLYGMDGHLLQLQPHVNDGCIDLSTLQGGIYILNVGDRTIKIRI